MTGAGSIRHNNRSFSAANVDRSRTEQNIVFCNEDLKQVYHMVFDEALAAYNAKKTKTRDKIPDYYEHIRQSKQEKLFHEAIFQIGNMSDCGCGTPDGERAAAALKDFAESFAERNPHLRVFNMVLHMDEATPHLHVDFIPVATEQSRGLSTRVSMKQALKQQGFVGVGRKQTEWAAWMEREKEALTEIAQRHDFEIISLGTNRPHMDLPQFKEAAARLEAVQQQTAAVEREVAELERQRDALKGTVRLLKEADRVNAPLHDIQPEKTLTGAVKGVTVDQVEQLKKMALRVQISPRIMKVAVRRLQHSALLGHIPLVQIVWRPWRSMIRCTSAYSAVRCSLIFSQSGFFSTSARSYSFGIISSLFSQLMQKYKKNQSRLPSGQKRR